MELCRVLDGIMQARHSSFRKTADAPGAVQYYCQLVSAPEHTKRPARAPARGGILGSRDHEHAVRRPHTFDSLVGRLPVRAVADGVADAGWRALGRTGWPV